MTRGESTGRSVGFNVLPAGAEVEAASLAGTSGGFSVITDWTGRSGMYPAEGAAVG